MPLRAISPNQLERAMYPAVCAWLTAFLTQQHSRATIQVFDSSLTKLVRLIQDQQLMANLPSQWQSWDIQVDVVGFIITPQTTQLAFVECKVGALALIDLAQILGYSRVALPAHSFIVSPQGASDMLRQLLLTYNRLDVLQYNLPAGNTPHSIIVAKWDEPAQSIDWASIITGDRSRLGHL